MKISQMYDNSFLMCPIGKDTSELVGLKALIRVGIIVFDILFEEEIDTVSILVFLRSVGSFLNLSLN